ncbi:hypothetical protein ABH926_006027 [Catenulispora sp. GP43]|uniref:hypothetical protein n=1 Tax=Catenulispora sp. GP43 TaxID=3156263 RepID=UPI0035175967
MGHHKSNQTVEGDPDTGHGGGLPRRPDDDELAERTEADRAEAGLSPDPGATPADVDPRVAYADGVDEIDREVAEGELLPDRDVPRGERPAFPPTRYDGG